MSEKRRLLKLQNWRAGGGGVAGVEAEHGGGKKGQKGECGMA